MPDWRISCKQARKQASKHYTKSPFSKKNKPKFLHSLIAGIWVFCFFGK